MAQWIHGLGSNRTLDIIGSTVGEQVSYYGGVSITHDGLTMAVGGAFGRLRIYKYDSTLFAWF